MKKLITLLLLTIPTLVWSQKTFKFDSLSVFRPSDTLVIKCKSSLIYTHIGFTLVSDDRRIYSFLLPGSEFLDLQAISFYDTKMTLTDSTFNSPISIYYTQYNDIQVAQYVRPKSITLMKKDKTGIIFY